MSSTDDLGELLDEYQLWVERLLDTRDAVRDAYSAANTATSSSTESARS